MSKSNVEIVQNLPNGKKIIKIEYEFMLSDDDKQKVTKYTIADDNGIINITDTNNNLVGLQFFDNYKTNEFGEIIIGIKKDGNEYIKRVLSNYDLSDAKTKTIEEPSGLFNIGPYERPYYKFVEPTKTIEEIIPQKFSFNYGLINRYGKLVIYPYFDDMSFAQEDTCIVGLLNGATLVFGYSDTLTGSPITPVCFSYAGDFNSKRARVNYNHNYGYIDREKIMKDPRNSNEYAENLEPRFKKATDFENDEAIVCITPATHLTKAVNAKVNLAGELEVVSSSRIRKKSNNIN